MLSFGLGREIGHPHPAIIDMVRQVLATGSDCLEASIGLVG
jgi:hypothetical protein